MEKNLRIFKKKYQPKRRVENQEYENIFEVIISLNEYDVKYSARTCIDFNIRVGFWYSVKIRKGFLYSINRLEELKEKPDFSILAYDIETTKDPLKFPNPDFD